MTPPPQFEWWQLVVTGVGSFLGGSGIVAVVLRHREALVTNQTKHDESLIETIKGYWEAEFGRLEKQMEKMEEKLTKAEEREQVCQRHVHELQANKSMLEGEIKALDLVRGELYTQNSVLQRQNEELIEKHGKNEGRIELLIQRIDLLEKILKEHGIMIDGTEVFSRLRRKEDKPDENL